MGVREGCTVKKGEEKGVLRNELCFVFLLEFVALFLVESNLRRSRRGKGPQDYHCNARLVFNRAKGFVACLSRADTLWH